MKKSQFKKFSNLDFADLNSLPSTCEVTQPDLSDLSQFIVTISPDDVNIQNKIISNLIYF